MKPDGSIQTKCEAVVVDAAPAIFHRTVERLTDAPIKQGMTPAHRARHLIEPGDWAAIDPFLLMAEDWYPRGVFDMHPHRGIETVTFVLEGRLDHEDNRGNKGRLHAGDAQWMTAGSGIIHNEVPAESDVAHSLQLWINLPVSQKMSGPRYQDLIGEQMPVRRESGAEIRVFSGSSGEVSATTLNHVPVTMLSIRLDSGASLSETLPAGYNGFVLILRGDAKIGGNETTATAGELAWLSRDASLKSSEISITAMHGPLEFLLIAGEPLNEPVAARGPFVMNTPEEISQAYRDYREGRFAV